MCERPPTVYTAGLEPTISLRANGRLWGCYDIAKDGWYWLPGISRDDLAAAFIAARSPRFGSEPGHVW
jgi:hypothetical protein